MKKILIIIIVTLLLGLLGAGGYYFLSTSKAIESVVKEEINANALTYPESYKQYSKPKNDSMPEFYAIEDIVVNFDGEGQVKYLAADINFMSYYPELVAKEGDLSRLKPIILNNIQKLFRGQNFTKLNSVDGPETLRKEVLDVVRQVLEEHKIYPETLKDVFFVRLVMQ